MYNETNENEVLDFDQIHGNKPYEFAKDNTPVKGDFKPKEYVRYTPPTRVEKEQPAVKEVPKPLYEMEREIISSPSIIFEDDDDDNMDIEVEAVNTKDQPVFEVEDETPEFTDTPDDDGDDE